jgi:hypothetical protein
MKKLRLERKRDGQVKRRKKKFERKVLKKGKG